MKKKENQFTLSMSSWILPLGAKAWLVLALVLFPLLLL